MARKGQPRTWAKWAPEEIHILRTTYPNSGRRGVQAALAAAGYTRSGQQIAAACARYHIPAQRTYLKFPVSSEVDNALIRAYQKIHKGEIGALKATAARLGRPYGWCKWRASQLGLVKPKKPYHRTPEEEAILAEHAELGLSAVQRELNKAGYKRSQSAIMLHRQKRGLSAEHPDLLKATAVGRMLGLDSKSIGRWIRREGLRAKKRRLQTPTDEPGDPQNWAIHRRDLAVFLRDHPSLWDVRRVTDHYWIVELLAGSPQAPK